MSRKDAKKSRSSLCAPLEDRGGLFGINCGETDAWWRQSYISQLVGWSSTPYGDISGYWPRRLSYNHQRGRNHQKGSIFLTKIIFTLPSSVLNIFPNLLANEKIHLKIHIVVATRARRICICRHHVGKPCRAKDWSLEHKITAIVVQYLVWIQMTKMALYTFLHLRSWLYNWHRLVVVKSKDSAMQQLRKFERGGRKCKKDLERL